MPRKMSNLATKKQSWTISRYQEGISLNPKEYVLDDEDGEVKEFDTVQGALNFLNEHGGLDQEVTNQEEAYDIHGVDIESSEESF